MSDLNLDLLIAKLSSLPSETSRRAALELTSAPLSPTVDTVVKQCSLVRWFDESLYQFLTSESGDRPELTEFMKLTTLDAMGTGRYAIPESERARLLEEWQSDESTWRDWNRRIGEHFASRGGADNELSAVYHLAAATDPTNVKPLFEQWYIVADKRFNTAQCSALLEMLRLQDRFRGPIVSRLWREWHRYFQARSLFADDYYKTGSYFERSELLDRFREVLEAENKDKPWIFHIHATGGSGKTMFLRWLLSRYLTVRRIPCARVDFDDFKPLNQVIDRPLRLLVRVVEQWSKQIDGLGSLLERLNREETTPGWNSSVMDEVSLQLAGVKLKTPLVIILDTLEEATLSHANWLKNCVNALRSLRDSIPRLKLVLSGRYDIAERSQALLGGESITYEIRRFCETEARAYLELRGIPEGQVKDAIIDRSREVEDQGGADSQIIVWNPFKLAIFAEIVLQRTFTAEEVAALPRADLAYLLERVIRRIDSQPVRWMIRYGAIARNLTLEFVEQVLLPPLRKALSGQVKDHPANDLDGNYQDTWRPDPELAKQLKADALWNDLKKFARDRGWLTLTKIEGQDCLRFHPEVLKPTRDLLIKQHIFPQLQQLALSYFENLAGKNDRSTTDTVRPVLESVFHKFQLQAWHNQSDLRSLPETAAWDYWRIRLSRSGRLGLNSQLLVAKELLGTDYAESERIPVAGVLTVAQLCEVHCVCAYLLVEQSGIQFVKGYNRDAFQRHVEAAQALAEEHNLTSVPGNLVVLADAWLKSSRFDVLGILRRATSLKLQAHWKLIFTLQVAQLLAEQRSHEAATCFRQALEMLDQKKSPGIDRAHISLELAAFYAFEGEHTAVIGVLAEARKYAKDTPRSLAPVLEREISYALAVGDVEAAILRIAELADVPKEFHSTPATHQILGVRLALLNASPTNALELIKAGRAISVVDLDVARLKDQEGEARAAQLEFRAALQLFEEASVSYDLATVATGSARCKVLASRLLATVMHNYREAEAVLRTARDLPGVKDAEIACEFLLIEAFTAKSRGNAIAFSTSLNKLLKVREPAWPPALRARALMFALLSQPDVSKDTIEELIETLSDVQPPTLRDRALEVVTLLQEPVKVPDHFVRSLMSLFVKSRPGSASGVRRAVRRVDLLRLLGQHEAAIAQLHDCERLMQGIVGEAAVILEWELNQARRRLGIKTPSLALMERANSTSVVGSTLYEVIQFEAAQEAHQPADAHRLEKLPAQPGNKFEAERLAWLASFPTATREDHANSQRYLQHLGWTELVHSQNKLGIAIREHDLQVPLIDARDPFQDAIRRLLNNWEACADDLSTALVSSAHSDLPEVVAIEPEARLCLLTWELATVLRARVLVHRTSTSASRVKHVPKPVSRRSSILYAGQAGSNLEALEAVSGGSFEEFYRTYGAHVEVLDQLQPRAFETAVRNTPGRVLIHIACTLRETASGTFLDFEETRTRAASFGLESMDTERDAEALYLSVTNLDRMLQRFKAPPFLVIDVANPFNLAEAIRMILLRNRFASQLFALGHVRGILGCGLASPEDRFQLSHDTVEALMTKSVGETLAVLRSSTSSSKLELEQMLPRFGAALWTNQPNDRLFQTRN